MINQLLTVFEPFALLSELLVPMSYELLAFFFGKTQRAMLCEALTSTCGLKKVITDSD